LLPSSFIHKSAIVPADVFQMPAHRQALTLAASVTDETMDNTNSNKMKKPALIVLAITTPDHLQNI